MRSEFTSIKESSHTYLRQHATDHLAWCAYGGAGQYTDEILQAVRDTIPLGA